MEHKETQTDAPASVLTALEDLSAEIASLQELVIAVAATARYLPQGMTEETFEQIH